MRALLAPADSAVAPGPVPSFSVVIPAYQAAAHIGHAIESLLAQTVPPLEIIVSDDGSTDDLPSALAPYGDRIRIVRGPNGGLPVARNRGFRAAVGEFIANLDADDALYPKWIEAVGELAAARPDLDILTTNGHRVDGEQRCLFYGAHRAFAIKDQRREILQQNFIPGFVAVRRSRFIEVGGFDEEVTSAWELWLRLIVDGSPAGCVDEALFEYRAREGSLSTGPGYGHATAVRVLEKALTLNLSRREREDVRATIVSSRRNWETDMLHFELVAGHGTARARARRLARDRGYGVLPRLKMMAAAVAPRFAGRILREIDRVTARPVPRPG